MSKTHGADDTVVFGATGEGDPGETRLIPRLRTVGPLPDVPRGKHRDARALIAALIPTCNEPEIEATIASITGQTLVPDYIVVVVNNSNDDTAERARAAGATHVIVMKENRHKKAGALNFGYDYIRVRLPDVEYIVQMDADTVLEKHFVHRTYNVMSRPEHWNVGALSSAFIAKQGLARNRWQSMFMWPQAAEYTRYQDSQVSRQVHCISGTGNMMRVAALDGLRYERKIIWDNRSLVEDYEVTLALRAQGWETRKSKRFVVYTDLMPNLRMLWKQRLRWQRGTFDELRRYGFTPYTRMDWTKQIMHGLLMLLHVAGVGYCLYSLILVAFFGAAIGFSNGLYLCLALIALKQAYHIRDMGWRSVVVSLLIIPEEVYNFIRHGWWLYGLFLSLRGRSQNW